MCIRDSRYIEEHYREGSLSELAEELHYDFYTLSRMIRRLTGKNYTELVQNKRLTQAAYLLETCLLYTSLHELIVCADIRFSGDDFHNHLIFHGQTCKIGRAHV